MKHLSLVWFSSSVSLAATSMTSTENGQSDGVSWPRARYLQPNKISQSFLREETSVLGITTSAISLDRSVLSMSDCFLFLKQLGFLSVPDRFIVTAGSMCFLCSLVNKMFYSLKWEVSMLPSTLFLILVPSFFRVGYGADYESLRKWPAKRKLRKTLIPLLQSLSWLMI